MYLGSSSVTSEIRYVFSVDLFFIICFDRPPDLKLSRRERREFIDWMGWEEDTSLEVMEV